MTTILKWSVAVFAFSQAVISTTYAKLPNITAAELIEAIKSADSRLVNVETKYIVDEQFNKTIHEKYGMPLKRKLEIHWRKEGIRDYIDVTCFDGRLILGKPFRFVMALNGEIRMQWTPNENKGDIFKKPYIHAWPIPFNFGLTPEKRGKMLGKVLEHCRIETLKEERWDNHECYYIEAVQPDKARIKAWIDPNAGYRAKHSQFWGPNGLIWHEASAEFKDCRNGIWFPVKGVFKRYGNDRSTGKRVVSCERRLKVEQVKVNADLTQKDFEIQFPHGTRVYVHTLNASYIAGVTSLDGFGEEALNPLVGKPLPELKDLKIDLSSADANDKMILVCFWDMQQRPSRNCIKELAKQAKQLKPKGVTVVAVQASKIDENKINEWVKKNNIPFPVGIIQDDEEKICFTWGIRSLPWLILTDREHVVRSEGFALTELDEAISAITQK